MSATRERPEPEYGPWVIGNTGQLGRTVTTWHPWIVAPGEWMPVVGWERHPDEKKAAS